MNIPIENRKQMIIEHALNINNYLDCDYVQECINELEKATMLNDIIMKAIDLKCGIEFRGRKTIVIENLINELSSLNIQLLANA